MNAAKIIHVVSCHAEGEVGDVIVGGVRASAGRDPLGAVALDRGEQTLRNFVLNEPRGGVFRHVNLLVPPKHKRAQMGFIIMEPEDTPPMSGSNCICVATVLLDTGILPMEEPVTRLMLEAPGGLVEVAPRAATARPSASRSQRPLLRRPARRRSRSKASARSPSTPPMAATAL